MEMTIVVPAAAAQFLCLKPSTLEKMRMHGGGPKFIRYGRAVRYDLEELKRWAKSREKASTSEQTVAA